MSALRDRLAGIGVAVASIVVLLAVGIGPFATPLWMYSAEDRAEAEAWTGWPAEQVHAVAGSALADVVLGPGEFAQAVDGRPVFSPAEVSHLRDVRRLAVMFYVAIVIAVIALVAARRIAGARPFWRGARFAARAVAITVVALGLVATFAFEPAFDVAHRLFFAAGTYSFDPATSRMVQLFPEELWFETAIALGAWLVVLAVALDRLAGLRLRAAGSSARVADGRVAPVKDRVTREGPGGPVEGSGGPVKDQVAR